MEHATFGQEHEGLAGVLGTVGQAMTTSVLKLQPEVRTSDAVAMLRRHGVGGAPVVESGRVAGVVRLHRRLAAGGPLRLEVPCQRVARTRWVQDRSARVRDELSGAR